MSFKNRVTIRQQNYTSLRATFRSENGAIDLASIMVGIIVIGLIGGIIAATVFAVIPWAQDNAAKQQLDSIHTAENASYGLSADPNVTTDQTKRNMFTDSQGLETSKLLAQNASYCVIPSANGKDYTAYAKSASGKIWTAMNSAKKAVVLSGTPTGVCSALGSSSGSAPVGISPTVNGGVVTTYSSADWVNTLGVVVDAEQTVYASTQEQTIKKMTSGGVMTVLAGGSGAGFTDGQGAAAQFNSPQGVAIGSDGNLYVADFGNQRIRMVTPTGAVTTALGNGMMGGIDGDKSTATLRGPVDIAFDAAGNMYIAEGDGKKVRKMTPAGVVSTLVTLSGSGMALDVDTAGNVYVSIDTGGPSSSIVKVTPAGVLSVFATSSTYYRGLAIEPSTGIIYAANRGMHTIEKILPDGTKTILAGTAGQSGNVNGTGDGARFTFPYSIAVDSTGALIVGSISNGDTTLRMIK